MDKKLDVEFEFYDVAVLHDVGFALGAEFAGFADSFFRAEVFEVFVVANRCSDEATLKIGMDGAGSFWGGSAFFDGPGATFFFAGGKETLET